jgi:hypothetical protein
MLLRVRSRLNDDDFAAELFDGAGTVIGKVRYRDEADKIAEACEVLHNLTATGSATHPLIEDTEIVAIPRDTPLVAARPVRTVTPAQAYL